jgi:ATP-dependent protease ClpP protease subunit
MPKKHRQKPHKSAFFVQNGAIQLPLLHPQAKRPFFARATGREFEVKDAGDDTVIDIYDEIGMWGVSAKDFRQTLKAIKTKNITVRINSPGGDVFDGIAMHNDLHGHPATVRVEVVGLAASAASIIAMAGDTISVADNAFIMIHNAWGMAVGDKETMAEFGAILEQIDAALARTYAERTGIEVKDIVAMMAAETWLSGADAVEQGFADEVGDTIAAKAKFDLSSFKNVPRNAPTLSAKVEAPATPRDLDRSLRDVGFSRAAAKATVHRVFPASNLRDAGFDSFTAALSQLNDTLQKELKS